MGKLKIQDKEWRDLTPIEKIKIEFEESSMLGQLYLWFHKKPKKIKSNGEEKK